MTGSGGLTRVATDDLEQLLAALESGALAAPLSKVGLGQSGYGPLWEALEPFAALDGAALRLLIQTVIAERRAHPQRRLDLVWSGPDAGPSHARYTRVVVPELFARAARHVTLAGYSFDHGERLFEPLHRSMIDRKVAVRVFIDVGQVHARLAQQLQRERRGARLAPVEAARAAGSAAYASAVCSLFHELYWPFGNPVPELYYDPRSADASTFASLHAKCIVVDHETTLITSANFTERGRARNLEVGVLIRDQSFAASLEQQWFNLIAAGGVVRWGGNTPPPLS